MELANIKFLPSLKRGIDIIKILNFFLSTSLEIYTIRVVPLFLLVWEKNTQVLSISIGDIKKSLIPKIKIDFKTNFQLKYHKFLDIFSYAKAKKLSEYYTYNYKIVLLDRKKPQFEPFYRMSQDKLQILKEYLIMYLDKSFI